MTKLEKLKEQIMSVIRAKLKTELSCDDLLKLSQAASELERNEAFKSLSALATSGFGSCQSSEVKSEKQ